MIQDWMVHLAGMVVVALVAFITIKADMKYVKREVGDIAQEIRDVVTSQGIQRVDHEVLKTEHKATQEGLREVRKFQDLQSRSSSWRNKETS